MSLRVGSCGGDEGGSWYSNGGDEGRAIVSAQCSDARRGGGKEEEEERGRGRRVSWFRGGTRSARNKFGPIEDPEERHDEMVADERAVRAQYEHLTTFNKHVGSCLPPTVNMKFQRTMHHRIAYEMHFTCALGAWPTAMCATHASAWTGEHSLLCSFDQQN